MFAGRKRDSQVWKHFKYDIGVNKCKCMVLDDKTNKECGVLVAGKNPTNLKAHLARHHQQIYSELKDEETTAKAAKRKREDDGGMLSTIFYSCCKTCPFVDYIVIGLVG